MPETRFSVTVSVTPSIVIATLSERETAIGAMAAACFTATFGPLYPPADLAAFLDQAFGAEGLPRHIADPGYRVRIALDDEAVVGFAKYAGSSSLPAPATRADAELKQLYVAISHHGAGVAAALMEVRCVLNEPYEYDASM